MASKISPAAVEFGARIRARRRELGLTQEQVGADCGLHRTYVGGIERGERNLSLMAIIGLAQTIGVDPGELMANLHDRSPRRRRT